jgi:hypothetical protein
LVSAAGCGDVVRERSQDGGDGERDDVTADVDGDVVVAVPFAPGCFAAVHAAVAFA